MKRKFVFCGGCIKVQVVRLRWYCAKRRAKLRRLTGRLECLVSSIGSDNSIRSFMPSHRAA
jgi:hypothetical protein